MKPRTSPMQEVNLIAKLADLQETDYHNTLVLHAVVELLIEKGLLSRDELINKVQELDKNFPYSSSSFVGRSG
ncbi:hypothetical protein [Brevibacillus sp. H7]|uniref:hypothetical protein n=1 Tax=Brevibacillus sp. H7 TaxID=3349138 RepID=UPI0037F16554